MKLTIILDPAHGQDVAGKRSPDGTHREYLWSRERCKSIESKLIKLGYTVLWTTKDLNEPGLGVRIISEHNLSQGKNALLISLHNDAYTDNWSDAHGYSVYTSPGKTKSDEFAQILINELKSKFPELTLRKDESDGDLDKEENFAMVKKTNCPSVLIEWLFQSNKKEVLLLADKIYNEKFEQCIIDSILKWK